jgi:hypothetical protein
LLLLPIVSAVALELTAAAAAPVEEEEEEEEEEDTSMAICKASNILSYL